MNRPKTKTQLAAIKAKYRKIRLDYMAKTDRPTLTDAQAAAYTRGGG